ncbi:MAG: CDP-glycerol glycerophosphotransferase family protein [Bacteroidetes bacterium]|nr:CDP-glycerol glycerophosphotransferase family protein [Bacteroidota bacterium]
MSYRDLLQGSGLFAFSDPAGAKACLGLAGILSKENPGQKIHAISNRQFDFYSDWDIEVCVSGMGNFLFPNEVDWVFTGTSHPEYSERFEQEVWKAANEHRVISYSFVDQWTNISLRFLGSDGQTCFPDKILVLDRKAYEIAVAEGLPEEKLEIIKNPYLEYIQKYHLTKFSRSEICAMFGVSQEAFQILYGPDPLTLRAYDSVMGFNEAQVLEDILLATTSFEVCILVKPHPLQPKGVFEKVISKYSDRTLILVEEPVDNLDLMVASDVVIGFYSNFLIEAHALGREVIRYFPDASAPDPIAHLTIGQKVTNFISLQEKLHNIYGSCIS